MNKVQSRRGKLLLMAAMACVATILVFAQAQKLTIINGPVVESAQPNNTTIAWTTNTGASTIVKYGTDQNSLSKTAQSPYQKGAGNQTHRVHISGLQPGTKYYYQAYSGQGEGTGTEATSPVTSLVTAGNGAASPAPQALSRTALYRLYSQGAGHFYTSSQQEAQGVSATGGMKLEGTTGYLLAQAADGTVPLFRVLLPGGQHFYTTDASERDGAVSNNGGKYEGITGYIATSQQPGTTPLYRLYNAQNRDHFYTTDASEKAGAVQQGYKDEGVAGYIWTAQQ